MFKFIVDWLNLISSVGINGAGLAFIWYATYVAFSFSIVWGIILVLLQLALLVMIYTKNLIIIDIDTPKE